MSPVDYLLIAAGVAVAATFVPWKTLLAKVRQPAPVVDAAETKRFEILKALVVAMDLAVEHGKPDLADSIEELLPEAVSSIRKPSK